MQFEEPLNRDVIAEHVLRTCKDQHDGTPVVGRHSFSWWMRLFEKHVGEELVRTGENVTVRVVE